MALACNIDAKGKAIRLIGGLLAILAGLLGYFMLDQDVLPIPETLGHIGVALVLLSGAFSIFEARSGWCAVRALGFRTRF
ncbi:MAG: hypothetical protein EB156_00115 [Euryarchaeota archaeon]|jgi:hypothetical protein|nr:hypothetical protein [Euryarchaeota archaeon]NDB93095.1 hypothetical protein [Euryarchaeota archaeon]NDF22157.1 hypothetical protein [Euryarchaeota archaeon]NDF36181.1 hypothetical protein [Euryarchaeota archaeon]NDG21044.1 hypothetical protein [Euryarchaeota archaeon]